MTCEKLSFMSTRARALTKVSVNPLCSRRAVVGKRERERERGYVGVGVGEVVLNAKIRGPYKTNIN